MSHLLAGAAGFFAGMLATAGIAVALKRRRWHRRYRPHRYEEIL